MNQQTAKTDLAEILDEIDKVDSVIATARRLLAEGKMVDLSALEGKVKGLCKKIESMAPGDISVIDAAVVATRHNLDLLENELTAQNESISGDIEGDDDKAKGN
ncbi:MAG: hypothetical protein HQ504_01690 [Rhodospirillaceae bacterium]|nr:hypothetical protein [Rhodospirillaceae bacterium]